MDLPGSFFTTENATLIWKFAHVVFSERGNKTIKQHKHTKKQASKQTNSGLSWMNQSFSIISSHETLRDQLTKQAGSGPWMSRCISYWKWGYSIQLLLMLQKSQRTTCDMKSPKKKDIYHPVSTGAGFFFPSTNPWPPRPCQKLLHPKPSHIVSASHPRHNAPANGGFAKPTRRGCSWMSQEVSKWLVKEL